MKFLLNDANDHRNDWVEDYDTENVDMDENTGEGVAPDEFLKQNEQNLESSDQTGGNVQSSAVGGNADEDWGVPKGFFDEN